MTAKIVRDIERPSTDLIDAFHDFGAADVHEAMDRTGAMGPEISRITGDTLCGPATTARLPTGDNMMVHAAAKVAEPGDVLVFEASTSRGATWGELTTTNAQRKGIEGVVSGGNVRDVTDIDAMGFPMFSRDVSHIGAVKETPGSVNIPVSVGGVIVNPGDLVIGDADGVTVVPREDAPEVLEKTIERIEKEDEIRARIRDGESLFEIAGYPDRLSEHGLSVADDGF